MPGELKVTITPRLARGSLETPIRTVLTSGVPDENRGRGSGMPLVGYAPEGDVTQAEQHEQGTASHESDVGDITDEQSAIVDEVDDMTPAEPGERKRRSSRWEKAPPRSPPSATVQAGERSRRPAYRMPATVTAAARANTHVAPVPIENAAPGLYSSRSWISCEITGMRSPPESAEIAQTFEAWSARRTTAASTIIRPYSRGSPLAVCEFPPTDTLTPQSATFSHRTHGERPCP